MFARWKKSYDKPKQCIKKQRYHFTDKGQYSQIYGFFSTHVWMWDLKHQEGRETKNWCFPSVLLDNNLESLLDCKEIKLVNLKGYQCWIFIGRTDAESEALILWPPYVKSWFTGKDPDARKDRRQEEIGATEDKMVGWHHWLNGHEFEQTLGDSEGQGSLPCCSYVVTESRTWLCDWTTVTISTEAYLLLDSLRAQLLTNFLSILI